MFQQSEVRFGLITCLRSSENTCFSPQLCVGFLFLILYPGSLPAASSFRLLLSDTPHLCHTQLCHILSFTHHLSHMSHTIFHILSFTHHLCHTPSFTYYLSHTICHIQSLSHTIGSLPSRRLLLQPPPPTSSCQSHTIFVTPNFVTYYLSHTICHIPSLSHTTLSHTIFYTLCGRFAWQAWHLVTSTLVSRGRRGTISHPRSFCVAGVAGVELGDIHLGFTWQAWRNLTSTVVLRGRRGSHGTGWRAWARLVARDAAAHCVAGVALGDIHLGFTWQAWHNLTSTVVLRSRRGTHGIGWRAWARFGRA